MMKELACLLSLVTLSTVSCQTGLDQSISTMLASLRSPSTQEQSISALLASLRSPQVKARPRIITKYDFMSQRDKKSHLQVPPPMVVSTGLTVTQKEEAEKSHRSGRSRRLPSGRKARTNFPHLARAVETAPLITGVRMPDDASDSVIHRNGRFINNVFVPQGESPILPPEFTVRASVGGGKSASVRSGWSEPSLRRSGRSYSSHHETNQDQQQKLPFDFQFRDFYSGRKQDMRDAMALESRQEPVYSLPDPDPVYFLPESPDSLHADRSPYTFEPADSHPGSQAGGPAVLPASNEDFVIKEHTYQMCPGCPTFSIPIPVPRTAASSPEEVINPYNSDPGYEYQLQQGGDTKSVVERIMEVVGPVLDSARDTIRNMMGQETNHVTQEQTGFSDRLSTVQENSEMSPLMIAGLAAGLLGMATLVTSGLQVASQGLNVGRGFEEGEDDPSINSLEGSLGGSEYNLSSDLVCMPRLYCEKWKSKKHLFDKYPNTKAVAGWLLGKVFDQDNVYEKGEQPFLNQCHLRECLYSLLD